jgi:hypothetical protein
MKHIKVFEKFNHRIPKEVNNNAFNDKLNVHGHDNFSEQEIEFFKKIKKSPAVYDIPISLIGNTNTIFIQLYPIDEDDNLIEIDIQKLKDDWYLIDEIGGKKYICDEWDEVLGYLGTKTTISL